MVFRRLMTYAPAWSGPSTRDGHACLDDSCHVITNESSHLPVLVGFDGSNSSLDAVAWAAREAEARGVDLHIVMAYSWLSPSRDDMQIRRRAHRLLGTASDVARGVIPAGRIRTALASGSAADALLLAARGACLVVIGHPQEGFIRDLVAPSLASRLSESCRVPVILMGDADPSLLPEAPTRMPVTVGLTESDASRSAAVFAATEAATRRVPLHVVHVVSEEGGRSLKVDAFLDRLVTGFPSISVSFQRPLGRAASQLVDLSGRSCLVVLGAHGPTSAHRHPLGVLLDQLAHRALCPIAIVGPRSTSHLAPEPWAGVELATSAR